MRARRFHRSRLVLAVIALGFSGAVLALDCPPTNNEPRCVQQRAHEAQQRAQQQQAQQKAQQEAQQRAMQQQAQQRAQQEAQQRAMQQQAQQRAQHEAQQRAQQQQAQQKAQQEAQQRAQQKAQQEAQQRAQQQAQQRAQPPAQPPRPPAARAPETVQHEKQQAQQRPQPAQAQQRAQPAQAQQRAQPQVPQQSQHPATGTAQGKPAQQPAATTTRQAQQPAAPAATTRQTPPAAPTTMTRQAPQAPAAAQTRTTTQQIMPSPTAKSSLATTQAVPATRVPISATTSVVKRTDQAGFAIHHQAKDGSQVVVTQRKLPSGTVQAVAYKESADRRLGTSTRVYTDGHRVVVGRDFQSRSLYSGPTYVTYNTGLRAAMLPSGKPIYRESFSLLRGADGRERRVINKTVYVNTVYGRPVFLASPVVRVYEETIVYGRPTYFYRPTYYEPVFYRPFWVPLAAPVVVTEACNVCPTRMVAFASPVERYDNPIDLVGDLQLSSAFEESAMRNDGDTAAFTEVRNQMSELTRNVSSRVETDGALKEQLGSGMDLQKVQQTMNELAPVQVPEDVRQQVRAQVRLSIAQHQNQHPAILSDVVSSGYAKIFLFQTSTPISVTDAQTHEECFLNTGDLIGFAKIPNGDGAAAQMKVVTSGAQSCQPKQVVEVPLTDLQEMLNAFGERVEDNMKRVNACITTPSSCIRA